MTKEKPLKKFRAGGISATIWLNEGEKDGKKFDYHTISVDRSYTVKDDKGKDEWKKTSSMRVNDLPKVALVSQLAYEFLISKED